MGSLVTSFFESVFFVSNNDRTVEIAHALSYAPYRSIHRGQDTLATKTTLHYLGVIFNIVRNILECIGKHSLESILLLFYFTFIYFLYTFHLNK